MWVIAAAMGWTNGALKVMTSIKKGESFDIFPADISRLETHFVNYFYSLFTSYYSIKCKKDTKRVKKVTVIFFSASFAFKSIQTQRQG